MLEGSLTVARITSIVVPLRARYSSTFQRGLSQPQSIRTDSSSRLDLFKSKNEVSAVFPVSGRRLRFNWSPWYTLPPTLLTSAFEIVTYLRDGFPMHNAFNMKTHPTNRNWP